MKWGERLKFEMERAEAYFWRQTADRRQIQKNYLAAKIWKSGFNYGKA